MKNVKFILLTLAVFSITVYITVSSGCSGGEENTIDVPEYEGIGPPPLEVTIDQLYEDYEVNEENAHAKYSKEKLLFYEVKVEEVFGKEIYMGEALGADDLVYVKLYFYSGPAKFKLREEYFGIMQNIDEDYVLNIIGECEGLRDGLIVIDDCWVESVIGDLGSGEEIEFY